MLGSRLTYTSRFGPGMAEIVVFLFLPIFVSVYISSFCFTVHSWNIGKPSHSTHSPFFHHITSQARGEGEHTPPGREGVGEKPRSHSTGFSLSPSQGSPFLYIFYFFTFVYFFYVRQVFSSVCFL